MGKMEYYLNKLVEKTLGLIAASVSFGGMLSGIGYLLFQIYSFLKSGEWTSYSLNYLIAKFGGKYERWASYPEEWLGLHRIFETFPLSLFLFLVGFFGGAYLFAVYEQFREDNEELFKT